MNLKLQTSRRFFPALPHQHSIARTNDCSQDVRRAELAVAEGSGPAVHLVQDDGEGVDVALGAVALGVPQALRGAVEVVETRGRVLGRLIIIVKLRQGSGKYRQGMAVQVKGLKA